MHARHAGILAVAGAAALGGCFLLPSFDDVSRDYGSDASSAGDAVTDALPPPDTQAEVGGGDAGGSDARDGSGGCDADLATDPRSCGACGHDCLGGACEGGACQPYVFTGSQMGATDLAVDDAYAYWSIQYGGTIVRKPLDGGPPLAFLMGLTSPQNVTVDPAYLVWTETGCANGAATTCAVRARDKGTGAVVTIDADAGHFPSGIASDGTSAFWPVQQEQIVVSAPEDGGGAAKQLAGGMVLVQHIVTAGDFVYSEDSNSGPQFAILQIAKAGGSAMPIDNGTAIPFSPLASNGAQIGWVGTTDAGLETIVVLQDSASDLFTALFAFVPGSAQPNLAMDANRIYWTMPDESEGGAPTGSVQAVALDGGGHVTLASSVPVTSPGRLASAPDSVLWIAPGLIMRVAK